MIKVTNPELPKYTAKMITFIDTKSIPPLEMGKEACQRTRGASGHSKKNLALENLILVSISENQIQCWF